ncbi:MAG: DALR anticodon-binding domain-containing protein [Patescibacteria group bacterium]|nr:DALR anticodon-binding domain-containing protein [Patescibacteria group bacterium]
MQFNADSDFVFNPEESIKLEGKTGPYILYAYARIQSIFRKLDTNQTPTMPADIQLSATEKSLMKLLIQYQDITTAASDKYDPAILTKYLYEVAKTFNGFYRDNKIMNISRDTPAGVSLQQQRIYIADKTATVLKNGLALLGIDVLDTM